MTETKLDLELFRALLAVLKTSGERITGELDGEYFTIYSLGDVQVTLQKVDNKLSFTALNFTVLGQDFFVEADRVVVMAEELGDDSQEPEGFAIEDPQFLHQLEVFLRWRLEMHSKYVGEKAE